MVVNTVLMPYFLQTLRWSSLSPATYSRQMMYLGSSSVSCLLPLQFAAVVTISILRQQLTKVKDVDPLLKRAGVVYKIPCSCGQEYIGETKRTSLETRLKEHQAATRRGETEKSAIAEHAWAKQHHPLWDETTILDQARNNNTLLIKEAFHITLTRPQKLLN